MEVTEEKIEQPQVEEAPVEQPQVEEPKEQVKVENPYEYNERDRNVAALREANELKDRELNQLRERLKKAEDDKYNIDDDDLVEGSHLKHYKKQLDTTKEEFNQKLQKIETKNKLISENNNFYGIVTMDNAEKLRKAKPKLFQAINSSIDEYSAGSALYEAIKEYVINPNTNKQEKKIIDDNLHKPKGAAQVSASSPLSYVNDPSRRWTQKEKDENWRNRPK